LVVKTVQKKLGLPEKHFNSSQRSELAQLAVDVMVGSHILLTSRTSSEARLITEYFLWH